MLELRDVCSNDDGCLRNLFMGIGSSKDPMPYTGDSGGVLFPDIKDSEYEFD